MDNKYLVLVNKDNKFSSNDSFNIISVKTDYNKDVLIEEKTYNAFIKLKEYAKENGYLIDIDTAYRSVEEQINVWNDYENKYGIEYTKKYVAVPNYSEHHTGLAVDYILKENDNYYFEQNFINHSVVDFIKNSCSKFGFILRYPEGKEDITGYGYESWHLRYIDNIDIATKIMNDNISFEEYLLK